MTIPFTTLLTQLGRFGRLAYLTDQGQALLPAGYTSLYAQISDQWPQFAGPIGQQQQNQTRASSGQLSSYATIAQQIFTATVGNDVPSAGTSLQAALAEFARQCVVNGVTFQQCNVSATDTPQAGNVGSGFVILSTIIGNGLIQQNIIAEAARIICTADSYTGSRPVGQEAFSFTGAPNTAGVWDYDWPQGSAANQSYTAVSADQNGNANGNLLTNGNFETWSGSPLAAANWTLLSPGVWGVDLYQSAVPFRGQYSLGWKAGTGNTPTLQQQFGASTGTTPFPTLLTNYPVNFWLRTAAGTASGGVMTISLVNGAGVVYNDALGSPCSFTVNMTSLTTAWASFNALFRLPSVVTAVYLQFKMTTPLTGTDVFMDDAVYTPLKTPYQTGPGVAIISGATPFRTGDVFNVTTTNDRGGSTYLASWQPFWLRTFQTPTFTLPYSASPSVSDTLIAGP